MNHGGGGSSSVALQAKVTGISLTAVAPTLTDVAGGTSVFTVNVPTLVAAGTGYSGTDELTVAGGTSTVAATIIVDTVDGLGAIVTYHLGTAGTYTVKPTDPVAVTGGSGNNDATFSLTWTTNAQTFYARVTYVFSFGEQNASVAANRSVSTSRKFKVASPAANGFATTYNVYVGTSAGTETLQATVNIGTDWTMPVSGMITGAAIPATITVDPNIAQNWIATLADNVTLANPVSIAIGQELRLWFTQDATGTRVLTYGTQWQAAGGVTTIALTTTANAKDLISAIADTATTLTARIQKAVAH